jgi:hypothetical protein
LGSVEPADIALELGAGDPAAAADVHRPELAPLDQGVDRRPPDPEKVGRLLGGQQQSVVGPGLGLGSDVVLPWASATDGMAQVGFRLEQAPRSPVW